MRSSNAQLWCETPHNRAQSQRTRLDHLETVSTPLLRISAATRTPPSMDFGRCRTRAQNLVAQDHAAGFVSPKAARRPMWASEKGDSRCPTLRPLPANSNESKAILQARNSRKDAGGEIDHSPRYIGTAIFDDTRGSRTVLQVSNVHGSPPGCLKTGTRAWIGLVPGSYALDAVMNRHGRPNRLGDLNARHGLGEVHRPLQLINYYDANRRYSNGRRQDLLGSRCQPGKHPFGRHRQVIQFGGIESR